MDPILGQILKQNPNTLDLSGGPQPQGPNIGGALNFLLPTGGAIAGDIFGGPLGGALGAGGGQALADILQGKTPGGDVLTQGAFGLGGGVLGGLLGKLGGGALTGIGEDLATGGLNLTKSQLARFAADNGGETAQKVLTDSGLAGANAEKLGSGIESLNQQYGDIANVDLPVDPNQIFQNGQGAVAKLQGMGVGSATKKADALQQELDTFLYPKVGITKMEDGSYSFDPNANPTMADINGIKQNYAKATSDSAWNSDPVEADVNRAAGNVARKTLNDAADANGLTAPNGQPLSQLGVRLMKLNDLLDTAQKRIGVGSAGNLFGAINEGLGLGGIAASKAVGINPLAGLLIPGARIANSLVRTSPKVAGPLSGILSGAGESIAQASPQLGIVGAGAGGALGQLLQPSVSPNPVTQSNNNNEQNPNEQVNNSLSGSNNTQSANGNQVSPTGVQVDSSGHYVLPDLNSVQTTIPGQIYPPEAQAADLQKVSRLPFYMQDAAINQIRTKAELNKQITDQYLSTHALAPDQVQMMQQLPAANDQLNSLRDLVKTEAGKNLLQGVINDNPVIQTIKAANDPKYAQMLSLMKTTRATAEYAQVHGRLSNFDIQNLSNTPGPGDTVKTALAKLDLQQATLADTYARNLPAYGYSLMAGNNQSTIGGAPSNNPAPITPTTGGIPTSLFSLLGLGQAPAQ